VERSLDKFLKLGEKWNAVLVLDEADIYLEARDLRDVQRNCLVSGEGRACSQLCRAVADATHLVFLRALEYYKGLLFLTTNRIKTFDEAFKSRIHVSLHYGPLKHSDRRVIWENHFEGLKGKKIGVEDEVRDYLFKDKEVKSLKWNGREIRNGI
jgi:hypothetical protein